MYVEHKTGKTRQDKGWKPELHGAVGSMDGRWKDQVLRRMDVWLDRRMAGCLKLRNSEWGCGHRNVGLLDGALVRTAVCHGATRRWRP